MVDDDQELKSLQNRLNSIILNNCNTVGCNNCGLKYGGYDSDECSATELQDKIMDIEMRQFQGTMGQRSL